MRVKMVVWCWLWCVLWSLYHTCLFSGEDYIRHWSQREVCDGDSTSKCDWFITSWSCLSKCNSGCTYKMVKLGFWSSYCVIIYLDYIILVSICYVINTASHIPGTV